VDRVHMILLSLQSDGLTLRLTGTGTRPNVWLRNTNVKPMDLSACVSEECGHGEGPLGGCMLP
jgi:hypothetical protein